MKVGVEDDQVKVALQALHGALEEVVFGAASLWLRKETAVLH